jgi:anti-sigma regulatory factor (Ser/Thr protein kinase)
MPTRDFFLSLKSQPTNLAHLRSQIRNYTQACHLPITVIDDVELAVDEAVTNVVVHAYRGRTDGIIEVRAKIEGQHLLVTIRDFGERYQPKPVSFEQVKKVLAGRTKGGMGRYIMSQCMDSVAYHSYAKKYNETLMTKKI